MGEGWGEGDNRKTPPAKGGKIFFAIYYKTGII
jgi:hypothetical protein